MNDGLKRKNKITEAILNCLNTYSQLMSNDVLIDVHTALAMLSSSVILELRGDQLELLTNIIRKEFDACDRSEEQDIIDLSKDLGLPDYFINELDDDKSASEQDNSDFDIINYGDHC